jgi:hypothetical protein
VSLIRFFEFTALILLASQAKDYFATFVLRCFTLPRQGNLPARLENFPVLSTDIKQYQVVRGKINTFMDSVLSGIDAEVHLNADEVNQIYLKGLAINKYKENFLHYLYPIIVPKYKNEYLYFRIEKKWIYQHYIRYPDTGGVDGVFTQTKAFSFKKDRSSFSVSRKQSEVNGRSFEHSPENNVYCNKFLDIVRNDIDYEAIYPDFFLFLFGLELSPSGSVINSTSHSEYQRAASVIRNIQTVEIAEHEIIMTFRSSSSS